MLDLSFLAAAAAHAAPEHGEAAVHAAPTALGLGAGGWVALAMLVVFAIMLRARVPALIAAMLDKQIAGIRTQLDEAAALRAEAEKLQAGYAARIAGAEKDAAAIIGHAEQEAAAIVARAKDHTATVIARREQMAKDKIAASERAALASLQGLVAQTATAAAGKLIADNHDAKADKGLVDEAIGAL